MLGNLINLHDFVLLYEKIQERGNVRVFTEMLRSNSRRVEQAWSRTNCVPKHWWDIPAVEKRWNLLITGDDEVEPCAYAASKFLKNEKDLTAISLGCGRGNRELQWFSTGKFRSLDAYDLSKEKITLAVADAEKAGVADQVRFRVANAFDLQIHDESYDVALLEGALHHFSPLEKILGSIQRWMKPGGYVIVNEFVGPSRFQWTDKQLDIVNASLSLVPMKYRTRLDGKVKSRMYRPGKFTMYVSDPSEAAESSCIMSLLAAMFDVVEVREYGGTILPLVLKDISHHFVSSDDQAMRVLKLLFNIEDELLRSKEIQSDYAFAICKKRRSHT